MGKRKRASQRSTLREEVRRGPARLVVLEGESVGRKISLDQELVVIGRSEDADGRFDDPQLSRKHAEIRREGNEYELCDLNSSNGTFINGAPIDRAPLRPEDKLRFGANLVMLFTHYDPIEDQLLQRQRLEALGRMGAGIAHDFNNMLGAIHSNLEYMESLPDDHKLGDETITEVITDLKTAAARAAQLSQRLLDFAKGHEARRMAIDVKTVIEEVALLARTTFQRSVAIETHIGGDPVVLGRSMELHQVLLNLCLNGGDAMPKGGTLSIRAESVASDQAKDHDLDRVRLSVSDTGTGIDAETLEHIFEPFYTTKVRGAGFGLGLSTVKEVVTLMGGTIAATSNVGKGTTFTIELPRAEASRKATTADPDEKLVYTPPAEKLLILLVDDEEVVRRGARRVLTRSGHQVIEASGGAEAIGLYARGNRPHLVILDLDMPNMNGEETLEALFELDKTARVLMVSGHRDRAREQQLTERGARGFLHKPWTVAKMLEAMELAAGIAGSQEETSPTDPGRSQTKKKKKR